MPKFSPHVPVSDTLSEKFQPIYGIQIGLAGSRRGKIRSKSFGHHHFVGADFLSAHTIHVSQSKTLPYCRTMEFRVSWNSLDLCNFALSSYILIVEKVYFRHLALHLPCLELCIKFLELLPDFQGTESRLLFSQGESKLDPLGVFLILATEHCLVEFVAKIFGLFHHLHNSVLPE